MTNHGYPCCCDQCERSTDNMFETAFWKGSGFDVWQTGGGCEALGKKLPDGGCILITDSDGGCLPDYGSVCFIGRYDVEGNEADSCEAEGWENALKDAALLAARVKAEQAS